MPFHLLATAGFEADFEAAVGEAGHLLSYTHLLGHKGTVRMIGDLQSYYFEKMYTLTKELVQSCWSCFLTNKGTRQVKLGAYKAAELSMST